MSRVATQSAPPSINPATVYPPYSVKAHGSSYDAPAVTRMSREVGMPFGWIAGEGPNEAFATHRRELTLLKDGIVAVNDAHHLTAVLETKRGLRVSTCYADKL